MNVRSLDSIVKYILNKRRYSLHWYLEFLLYCKEGLGEIALDDIQVLRYKVLTLNDNNALDLPNDYVDICRLSARFDQYLYPLVEDNALDLVPNYDSTFNIQPYSQGIASQSNTANSTGLYLYGYYKPYWFMTNWNNWGENIGRMFGGVGAMADTFRVNKARNEIKVNENLNCNEYVLEYIGDGTDADSATHIEVYARAAIEAYAMWQFKENNRTYSEGEAQVAKQDYMQQRMILRARVSDLTVDKLKRIVQQNSLGVKY